jgi:microcystin degradation protein MlrC
MQETNSFSPVKCSMEFFQLNGITRGEDLIESNKNTQSQIAGFINAAIESGNEIIPALSMFAQSNGPVEPEAAEYFLGELQETIKNNEPIDGLFLSLHGATQLANDDDGAGFILEALRKTMGQDRLIACSTDLHANITKKMLKNANVICGFHTYPHIDLYQTAYRAATLGLKFFEKKGFPVFAAVKIPMIVPAEGYSTNDGAFKDLTCYADDLQKKGIIQDFSLYQMQPWLDVSEGGSCVIVGTENRETAGTIAMTLAKKNFESRKDMGIKLYNLDDVIDMALANNTEMPVVVVDSADSSNAGACGDSPAVIRRLIERKVTIRSAAIINDVPAVKQAFKTGVGNSANFLLGGTLDKSFNVPLPVYARVKSLHDGIFIPEGNIWKGKRNNIGKTAVLQIGNIDVVVCQCMINTADPQLYRAFGVEPALYKLVVVKSATQYKVNYNKFTTLCYPVDTPGAATAKLDTLKIKKLPRPFYPFDDIDTFHPEIIYMGEPI